jgi:hypothetical protein
VTRRRLPWASSTAKGEAANASINYGDCWRCGEAATTARGSKERVTRLAILYNLL